jgi:hypothetical protein
MRAWVATVRSNSLAIPRPRDEPRVHADGPDPDRILLIGSGPAVGWGVLSQDLSLGGVIARALAAQTHRGVDMDIVGKAGLTAETSVGILNAMKLWRYDGVIVTLGLNEAMDLVPRKVWRERLSEVLDVIAATASRTTEVFVLGIPPMRSLPAVHGPLMDRAQKHANGLDVETQKLCSTRAMVRFIPLTNSLDDIPIRNDYQDRGTWLAEQMAPVFQANYFSEQRDRRLTVGFDSESDRQSAVDSLADSLGESPERFDRIVSLARELFGTATAMFTVLDGDRQRHVARVGLEESEVPRTSSFCTVTIEARGLTVIPDALQDERFDANPMVKGDPHIRFYAGYPIESASGEPIGALCVFDPQPREESSVDKALLRRLALLIQAELLRPTR